MVNPNANQLKPENIAALSEALDDVHTRFILNLPDAELESGVRVFFQLEQAHWYYEDFLADTNPLLPHFKTLKSFSHRLFLFSPLLAPLLPQFPQLWNNFSTYKKSISTYGLILTTEKCDKVALTRTWDGKQWTLPSGKLNEGEAALDCAVRETYEETGFDASKKLGLTKDYDISVATWTLDDEPLTFADSGKGRTVYVCQGVPEDFPFEPVARKEVSAVEFFDIHNLPKKTFNVLPFMKGYKRWCIQHGHGKVWNQKKGKKNDRSESNPKDKRSNSNQRSASNQNQRATSNKKDRENTKTFNAAENDGWSVDDMFKINEQLTGRKPGYDGNPQNFDNGEQYRVVGGSFMNQSGTVGGGSNQRLHINGANLIKPNTNDGFVSFFDEGGATPWENDTAVIVPDMVTQQPVVRTSPSQQQAKTAAAAAAGKKIKAAAAEKKLQLEKQTQKRQKTHQQQQQQQQQPKQILRPKSPPQLPPPSTSDLPDVNATYFVPFQFNNISIMDAVKASIRKTATHSA
ncbi:hypothetical protein TrLO_g430 [Triparma laevis f. longispina]|uniref:Nudix hydrolase domain-containing protein n=1 Tax=Triparma laevis f. longispina TaxID=1714387 RepID=A0A9W7A733_9STRA|nr:hypothetical protein TrLO_g430 [Triparma laevis f. longispina]